jgi:hypothetical protein
MRLYICPSHEAGHLRSRAGKVVGIEVWCRKGGGPLGAFMSLSKDKVKVVDLKRATKHQVPLGALLAEANRALMQDVPPERLAELFRAFVGLGYTLNRNAMDSVRDGVFGLVNQSWRRLDNIGIKIRMKEARKAYPRLDPADAWMQYGIDQALEKWRSVT